MSDVSEPLVIKEVGLTDAGNDNVSVILIYSKTPLLTLWMNRTTPNTDHILQDNKNSMLQ